MQITLSSTNKHGGNKVVGGKKVKGILSLQSCLFTSQ